MPKWVESSPDPAKWDSYIAARSRPETLDADSCIIWTASLDDGGYGCFAWREDGRTRQTSASRAAWLARVGPIKTGYVPDHLCRNRACVNVAHMEIVTQAENMRRAVFTSVVNPNFRCGHPKSDENVRLYRGVSRCRQCHRDYCRERYARLRVPKPPRLVSPPKPPGYYKRCDIPELGSAAERIAEIVKRTA